jgi:DNA mismatch repair protein MutS
MTQNLTSLYRKFYETYSKKYGVNTCILLLVGKFYELYDLVDPTTNTPFTSMRKAIEMMNIALKEKPNYGPNKELGLWSGFPEQSLHKFAQVLTREGWTVVVVDQVKDAANEVIDRVATRILSPGTHVETATSDRMTVAAIWLSGVGQSAAQQAASIIDLTTGEVFSIQTKSSDEILHMLQVYCVKEIVVTSQQQLDQDTLKSMFNIKSNVLQVPYSPHDNFEGAFAREEYLRKLFRQKTMVPIRTFLGLDPAAHELIERSLCLLLRFVQDHFPQQADKLTTHELYTPANYMRLSNNIIEQLNIITTAGQRSVLNLLERTHSALGKRTLRERILRPITDPEELETRWKQVEWGLTAPSITRDLKALYDLPRLHYKFAEGSLESLDILQLCQSYSATACLMKTLKSTPLTYSPELQENIIFFRSQFVTLVDEEKARRRENDEPTGFLTAISGPQTMAIEQKIQDIHDSWAAKWAAFSKEARISTDSFKLEKKSDGQYAWEGPRSLLKTIQAFLFTQTGKNLLTSVEIDHKKSGPISLSCAEFYTFSDRLRNCVFELNTVLKREVRDVCDTLWDTVHVFQNAWFEWLGRVDCTMALAAVARDLKWSRPCLGDSLKIEGLRHPLLETAQTRVEYVKHSVELGGSKAAGWLIYGVNASGKSSLMKAVGISVVLAQAGSFVPADAMCLRPYDAAFSRIWNHDNLWAGLSSFAVEVAELRDILNSATERSLVLGDEVCSGTESMSATALVASVLEHLDTQGCHFMFATHLHDLMKVPGCLPRPGIAVWHLRVHRGEDGKLIYDRTLQPGSGSCTYGLEVARAMGLPLTVMERAHEIRRALGGEVAAGAAPKSSWNTAIQRCVCEVCGSSFVRDLEVHHIEHRAAGGGNQLRNLVVLCESCHDKTHSGELEVGGVRMTSEGQERVITVNPDPSTSVAPVHLKKAKWTEEEMETIRATIKTFTGRPLTRTCLALEEQGIRISTAQLKKFV